MSVGAKISHIAPRERHFAMVAGQLPCRPTAGSQRHFLPQQDKKARSDRSTRSGPVRQDCGYPQMQAACKPSDDDELPKSGFRESVLDLCGLVRRALCRVGLNVQAHHRAAGEC
jgi:hypothetical protein